MTKAFFHFYNNLTEFTRTIEVLKDNYKVYIGN